MKKSTRTSGPLLQAMGLIANNCQGKYFTSWFFYLLQGKDVGCSEDSIIPGDSICGWHWEGGEHMKREMEEMEVLSGMLSVLSTLW